jgi:uncharacterized protein YdeI (YjbR/CyaY-like superfamily)
MTTPINANPKAGFYFADGPKWEAEKRKLRQIALDCMLQEEVKWGCPCYTSQKRNVVLIHVFKEYCALLFFQGALMKDPKKILVQQTENVQAARQLRFTSLKEIEKQEAVIKAYILEAEALEKSGQKVVLKKTAEYPMPDEFKARLSGDAQLKLAFEKLSPGRQRAYLYNFGQPKQSATREARIDKYYTHILAGKGIDD